MPISTIITKTNEISPNTIIYGSPTIENGVVSNFSRENYLELPDNLKGNLNDGRVFIIKFTTGEIIAEKVEVILHSEFYFAIEKDSSSMVLGSYNWERKAYDSLFTLDNNTTYWLKVVIVGQARIIYSSTDGINYVFVASSADNTLVYDADFPITLGDSSIPKNKGKNSFSGSIDLNECKVLNSDETVILWSGMDNNTYTLLGGDIADGQWIDVEDLNIGLSDNSLVFSNVTVNNTPLYYTISQIPFDGYDYEAIFESFATTGATSGNTCAVRIQAGDARIASEQGDDNHLMDEMRSAYIVTRASSTQRGAIQGKLVLKAEDSRMITVFANGNANGTLSLYIRKFRRLGRNDQVHNKLQSVQLNDDTPIKFGGKNFNGQPVVKYLEAITAVDIAKNTYKTISLTDYLPQDNCIYEVYGRAYGRTDSTSGHRAYCRIGSSTESLAKCPVVFDVLTRTSNYMANGGNFVCTVSQGENIYVWNADSTAPINWTNVHLLGYRRIGKNFDKNKAKKEINISRPQEQINGEIYGNLTQNGANITNMISGDKVILPFMPKTGTTVYLSFTTPSESITKRDMIYHQFGVCSIEVNPNGYVCTWLTTTDEDAQLFEYELNTKYWVKIEFINVSTSVNDSGCYNTDRTINIWYSTDGETYTKCLANNRTTGFPSSFINHTSLIYPCIGGNSIPNNFPSIAVWALNGIIHLDECYAEQDGEIIWTGLSKNVPYFVGGNILDGEYFHKSAMIVNKSMAASTTETFTLYNYLPDNDNWYEVKLLTIGTTGTSSGNSGNFWLAGSTDTVKIGAILGYGCTRTASSFIHNTNTTTFCKQDSNGQISFTINNTAGNAATVNCWAVGYRRIGTNE